MSNPTQVTVETNSEWFKDNDHYAGVQSQLECYQHIKRIVEREVRGVGELLDVGNGGFFNYDTNIVGHVTAVDLFLKDGPGSSANSTFRQGSFLELPFPDESFDCILEQNVFHHVTGRTIAENHANLLSCMKQMYRCVRPGGKVVVIESTVPRWFYLVEWLCYRPLLYVKRGGHPVTFQFTARQIIRCAESCNFQVEEYTLVPRGNFVLQFGHVWPTWLTPACPIKLVLRRQAA